MSLEEVTLTTDKSDTDALWEHNSITLRQSEIGLTLPVRILGNDDEPYDLTGKTLVFSERKQGKKAVIDDGTGKDPGKFTMVDAKNGRFLYRLQVQAYTAPGRAWFEIKDGDTIVDSTETFRVSVIIDPGFTYDNLTYVTSMQGIENQYQNVIDECKQKVQENLDELAKQVSDASASTEQTNDELKQSTQKQIDDSKSKIDDALSELQTEYSNYSDKYQKLEAKLSDDLEAIKDSTSQDLDKVKADAHTQTSQSISQIEQAKEQAIGDAKKQFSNELDKMQTDYEAWKEKTAKDLGSILDPLKEKLSTSSQEIADAQDSIQKLESKLSSVDFTKFAKVTDVYTKADIDDKLAQLAKASDVTDLQKQVNSNQINRFATDSDAEQFMQTNSQGIVVVNN